MARVQKIFELQVDFCLVKLVILVRKMASGNFRIGVWECSLTSGFLTYYARRPTASGHTLNCYFCKACGTRLIHSTPGKEVVSVKGGCIEGLDWSKAKHIWCKRAGKSSMFVMCSVSFSEHIAILLLES